jgi:hypothetical protein
MKKRLISGAVFACAMVSVGLLPAWARSSNSHPTGEKPPGEQPGAPSTMTTSTMTGPLAANPNPISFDAGPLGPVYLTGAVSGLGLWQNNTSPGDQHSWASLSNAQLFLQKTDGVFQYDVQVGTYTIPDLGIPYVNTLRATADYFGPVPMAYVKVAPTDTFSIQAGKLLGLIGVEYNFSFQNMNIERGLLWNQEPQIGRGGQLNYTAGPLALGFSLDDGFLSHRHTSLSGSASYTLDSANSFVSVAGGSYANTTEASSATASFQNNQAAFTLVCTYNAPPWTITPYFQYTNVPAKSSIGAFTSASTLGGAILANYSFGDDSPLPRLSLPIRFEYISSTGSPADGAPNLLYGPGSNAWSVTVTPTYQYKIFFARAEFSFVRTSNTTAGLALGPSGTNTTQTRVLFETGILF